MNRLSTRTDSKVAQQLYPEPLGAARIVNLGAGTGSYEPENVALVAVEPASEMISQRKLGYRRVEQAFVEKLPFGKDWKPILAATYDNRFPFFLKLKACRRVRKN